MVNEINKKANSKIGFGMIALAFVFYFFPDFSLIDVFPDVITYILLCVGLNKLSYMNDSIESARKLFFRMIIVSAAKLVAIFVTFGTANREEQASLMLLMVFVLALVEVFFLLPAYIHLFEGILYLGMRYDSKAVFGEKKRIFSKNATEKIRKKTLTFVIVKNLALVLPETAALSTTDSLNPYKVSMYEFIPHFRIFGMIISLIFGIVWLVSVISYFRKLNKDTEFVCALSETFKTEIMPNTRIFIERKVAIAALLLGLSAIFTVDFYIDGNNGFNIIPDILFAFTAFFGIFMLKKYMSKTMFALSSVSLLAYGVMTTVNWKVVADFAYKYTAAQVRTNAAAYYGWLSMLALTAVEAVLFIFALVMICAVLKRIISDHTGHYFEHTTIDPQIKLRETHKALMRRVYIFAGIGILGAIACFFRVYMFKSATELADVSWIIEALISAVFAVMIMLALAEINEKVKEKYTYL